MSKSKAIVPIPRNVLEKVTQTLMDVVSQIPSSKEAIAPSPYERAKRLSLEASVKAALVSGTLSVPLGPVGMLTVLPDLAAVWRIQRQLVADIASCYDQKTQLGKEQMLYCLFKHTAGQIVRDVVVRVGERLLVRKASLRVMQSVLRRIGIIVTQRVLGRALSHWLPVVGAVGIGAYAFYDTAQVAKTAIFLFESQVHFECEA